MIWGMYLCAFITWLALMNWWFRIVGSQSWKRSGPTEILYCMEDAVTIAIVGGCILIVVVLATIDIRDKKAATIRKEAAADGLEVVFYSHLDQNGIFEKDGRKYTCDVDRYDEEVFFTHCEEVVSGVPDSPR